MAPRTGPREDALTPEDALERLIAEGRHIGFERMDDGGVLVGMVRYIDGTPRVHTVVISPEEWCESIAAVSPLGLNAATLTAAKRFHGFDS